MKRLTLIATAAALIALAAAPAARAEFGIKGFDVTFANEDGSPATQAGSHPFAVNTGFETETLIDPKYDEVPDEQLKSLLVKLAPGFTGSPIATPRCETVDFLTQNENGTNNCPDSAAVGATIAEIIDAGSAPYVGVVYNLVPPPGVVAKIGFFVTQVPVTIEVGIRHEAPYGATAALTNVSQIV